MSWIWVHTVTSNRFTNRNANVRFIYRLCGNLSNTAMRSTNAKGFTYNDKKNVFVTCISGDGNNQIFYELNSSTFEIVGTYKFDPDKMGHCNTMCYYKYTQQDLSCEWFEKW